MSNKLAGEGLGDALWAEILEFLKQENAADGALARRLLALCMNAAAADEDVWDPLQTEEMQIALPVDRTREDAEEWDFVDPIIAAKTKMKEPLNNVGISQADIINRMIEECRDEPELAERLRNWLEKYF